MCHKRLQIYLKKAVDLSNRVLIILHFLPKHSPDPTVAAFI